MRISTAEKSRIKLVAFDLDGTLTQHRSNLGDKNRALLDALGAKYKLLMAGAGDCRRIFNQMGGYPIDIIGNYGLQYARYDAAQKDLVIVEENVLPCERESVWERVASLRTKYGYTRCAGESVEFHASGAVTIPLLGTAAKIENKLAFDPTREKRRAIYGEVCGLFPDYRVFVGGSSSFDMVPHPYGKYRALELYCARTGLAHKNVIYVGDDYGPGGNDEDVYLSDFPFVATDDYNKTAQLLEFLL